jgi:hypothetical protein
MHASRSCQYCTAFLSILHHVLVNITPRSCQYYTTFLSILHHILVNITPRSGQYYTTFLSILHHVLVNITPRSCQYHTTFWSTLPHVLVNLHQLIMTCFLREVHASLLEQMHAWPSEPTPAPAPPTRTSAVTTTNHMFRTSVSAPEEVTLADDGAPAAPLEQRDRVSEVPAGVASRRWYPIRTAESEAERRVRPPLLSQNPPCACGMSYLGCLLPLRRMSIFVTPQ